MRIRPYEGRDAGTLVELFRRSVKALGPRDYTAAQVEAWAARAPDVGRMRCILADGRSVLVAVDEEDVPMAFGDLEPDGHIEYFYCAPEAAGTGVASALYDALEAIARERGLARLFVEASEAARRLFLRKGFAVLARRELMVSGVAIHNFAMEKRL